MTHLLCNCWWSVVFWKELGFEDWIERWKDLNGADWLCLIGVWLVWYNRNSAKFQDSFFSPTRMALRCKLLYKDFTLKYKMWSQSFQVFTWRWHRPGKGWIKINVDASWDIVAKDAGLALIVRDDRGLCLHVKSWYLSSCEDALSAEGRPLQGAMQVADKLGWSNVVFESDCVNVVEAVNGCACASFLAKHSDWKLIVIRRESNGAADTAAKWTRRLKREWHVADCCPIFLQEALSCDYDGL